MKFEEGKSYIRWAWLLIGFWVFISVCFEMLGITSAPSIAFSISTGLLVVLQLYSGVALDKSCVANIAKAKNPAYFYTLIAIQGLICIYMLGKIW